MIQITRNEADFLRSKNLDNLIHISSATHKSRAKRYYMTEDRKGLKLLKVYREKQIASSYS